MKTGVSEKERWRASLQTIFNNFQFFKSLALSEVIHSFIRWFYFAINQKYNNSIQKYIKDNIQYSTELSYLQD